MLYTKKICWRIIYLSIQAPSKFNQQNSSYRHPERNSHLYFTYFVDSIFLDIEFVKDKLLDEFSYSSKNKNSSSLNRGTAYKIVNKTNENKKYCSFWHRENHTRDNHYYLKSKEKNLSQRNKHNRNKQNNNKIYEKTT